MEGVNVAWCGVSGNGVSVAPADGDHRLPIPVLCGITQVPAVVKSTASSWSVDVDEPPGCAANAPQPFSVRATPEII